MKTFIAGSPIYTNHIGLGCISTGRTSGRALLAPVRPVDLLPSLAPSFPLPSGAASHPQAIWVGALVRIGSGSAPSDPRRTYYIGNQGNRKPEKIRKIGKVSFNQSILIHSNLRAHTSSEPSIVRGGRADRSAWQETKAATTKAWPLWQVPPCKPYFPERTY